MNSMFPLDEQFVQVYRGETIFYIIVHMPVRKETLDDHGKDRNRFHQIYPHMVMQDNNLNKINNKLFIKLE